MNNVDPIVRAGDRMFWSFIALVVALILIISLLAARGSCTETAKQRKAPATLPAPWETYKTETFRFVYSQSDWYVADRDQSSLELRGIQIQARLLIFDSYTTDPDLGRNVDAFTKLSQFAEGYNSFTRSEFKTKAGKPGLRTTYVMRFHDGSSVAFIQYWFKTDDNVITVMSFVCPTMLKDIYLPAFDKIAETAVF